MTTTMTSKISSFRFTCPNLNDEEVFDFLTGLMSDYASMGGGYGSFSVTSAYKAEIMKLMSAVKGHYPKAKITVDREE